MSRLTTTILGLLMLCLAAPAASAASDCVVLLHGLGRTSLSMSSMEERLQAAGFRVINEGYPSRDYPIATLAELAVNTGVEACGSESAEGINFVTHSLGSILVRYYFAMHTGVKPGRVVMLGPPNQGSEIVDSLKEFPGFDLINGPSGDQLGTESNSIPVRLGPVNFEVGVIAGSQSLNPIYALIIPGEDDGKVSIESTRVEGMQSHIVLPVTHTWMMFNDEVIDQVVHFLKTGAFFDGP